MVFSGVPHGSHVGPLLFQLFINNINSIFKYSKFLLFVDDLKLYLPIRNVNDRLLFQTDV